MRKRELKKKTRMYYWLMIAKIIADITIILGIFIIFFVLVRRGFGF